MNINRERLDEAKAKLESLLSEYADVMGPDIDTVSDGEKPILNHWMLVMEWQNIGENGLVSWVGVRNSDASFALKVGMLTVALDMERHSPTEE